MRFVALTLESLYVGLTNINQQGETKNNVISQQHGVRINNNNTT
jgi:hypothetical protein